MHDRVIAWIPSYGIRYDLGDRRHLAARWCCSTIFLVPLVILGSWKGDPEALAKEFGASLLLLDHRRARRALLAFDLFLFYVFWEVMLIPMYLLIGIWGGERRIYAAIKFFLFTMAGSAADAGRHPLDGLDASRA